MERVKILHFSDLHFDTPFRDLPKEIGDIRRAELRDSFSRIIDLAINESVQILLMAGDLFDNLTVEKDTLKFIQKEIKRLGALKVFISAGNHDPYNEKSFYKMIDWGENVYIFKDKLEFVEIPELKVVVYGASFGTKYIRTSQLNGFIQQKSHEDNINLMLLHGTISSSGEGEEYNPIAINDIGNSKMDYIALGHIHSFSGIKREVNTSYAYCGCPEGRGFDELGEKGIIMGYVGRHYVDLKFIPLSKRKYYCEEINVSDCQTNEDIKETILKHINLNECKRNLYKIILKGEIKEDVKIKEKLLENLLKSHFFFVKIQDKTTLQINKEQLKNEFSLKGVFCSKVLEKIDNCDNEEEREILELAFKIGIQSLCEGEVNLDDY